MSQVRAGASVVFLEEVKLEVMEMAPLITFSLQAFRTGEKSDSQTTRKARRATTKQEATFMQ